MRTKEQRIAKYTKKNKELNQAHLKQQIKNKKKSVVREQELEQIVNGIVGFTILRGHYMIYAKQVNKLMGNYHSDILNNEVTILQNVWHSRGLDLDVMDVINPAVGYIVKGGGPPPVCGQFDVSKFDIDVFCP